MKKKKKNPRPKRSRTKPQGVAAPQGPSEIAEMLGQPEIPTQLPILPVRGTLVFPGTIIPLGIGRPSSRQLLEESLSKSNVIGLAAQIDEEQEDPGFRGVHKVGVAALALKLIRQQDDTMTLIVHGLSRIRLDRPVKSKPYLTAKVSTLRDKPGRGKAFKATINQMRDLALELIELTPNAPEQARNVLMNVESPSGLVDYLAANIDIDIPDKQAMLEELSVTKRAKQVHHLLSQQLQMARLQDKIQQDVEANIGEGQRRLYLREQMRAIQEELGEGDGSAEVIDDLHKRLVEAAPPEKVMEEAERELSRLEMIPPASPEYSVIMSYVELIAELPWNKSSKDRLDLKHAREILDRDHFDLDKVKRRLIEYLAVRKLNPSGRGAILCLSGPPGVGKTSLGKSIAEALGREFARISMGGVRDEAEVRGHRRTYIGAMPGRLIQDIRRCGTNNPVIMLDEVDKLGNDFRGDPASALLEVLDPRQNHAFVDRYLDVPFDLSKVMFICTANYIGNIPPALLDRLEVIDIPGYTDHDKLAIAKKYLAPRQMKEHGLKAKHCAFRVAGLRKLIDGYTREAGVRELERQIGAVCRAVAAKVAQARRAPKKAIIDAKAVADLLGPQKYVRDLDIRAGVPGVALGLAYTSVGGEVLFIEATQYPGKGQVKLTGQIGDVMKESAQAALSLFKSRAEEMGFDADVLNNTDLHIHVPAGAVPKDGPSAGGAMYTAIASLISGKPVKKDLAMTGEITLRGKVLPIGGVKEKTLAADRLGIKTVLLPELNRRDLEEIDPAVRKRLKIVFAEDADQLLKQAIPGLKLKQ
ncbi:MAG: endopeptidase La [Phycisphaeraceae bacterium]|nr:endopeptidase La [Phycisphaeraceae bacterium]